MRRTEDFTTTRNPQPAAELNPTAYVREKEDYGTGPESLSCFTGKLPQSVSDSRT